MHDDVGTLASAGRWCGGTVGASIITNTIEKVPYSEYTYRL